MFGLKIHFYFSFCFKINKSLSDTLSSSTSTKCHVLFEWHLSTNFEFSRPNLTYWITDKSCGLRNSAPKFNPFQNNLGSFFNMIFLSCRKIVEKWWSWGWEGSRIWWQNVIYVQYLQRWNLTMSVHFTQRQWSRLGRYDIIFFICSDRQFQIYFEQKLLILSDNNTSTICNSSK